MTSSSGAPAAAVPAVIRLATGFWLSQALYAVAKLGVADRLRDGALAADDLAVAVGAHPGALRRVLRALASAGSSPRPPMDAGL